MRIIELRLTRPRHETVFVDLPTFNFDNSIENKKSCSAPLPLTPPFVFFVLGRRCHLGQVPKSVKSECGLWGSTRSTEPRPEQRVERIGKCQSRGKFFPGTPAPLFGGLFCKKSVRDKSLCLCETLGRSNSKRDVVGWSSCFSKKSALKSQVSVGPSAISNSPTRRKSWLIQSPTKTGGPFVIRS